MSTCLSKGYTLSGTEYADECYCANSYAPDSVLASSGCNMPCAGNSTETCGGPNRLTTYNYTLGIATTTTVASSTTSLAKSSTTVTTATATATSDGDIAAA